MPCSPAGEGFTPEAHKSASLQQDLSACSSRVATGNYQVQEKPGQTKGRAMFLEQQCNRCGECLMRCPELSLSKEEAAAEVERLITARESKYVLTRCSSCLSCNSYCPNSCNPYHLILTRWNDRYRSRGTPPLWKMVFPNEAPNVWSSLHAILPQSATEILEAWMKATPTETVFLPGSFFHIVPEVLAGSRLLDGMTVLDIPGHWECGAYLCQGGYLDVVKRIGQMVRDDFNRWGVKKIITAVDAVELMFTKIHPEENEIHFDQEIVNFHGWLLHRIESEENRMLQKLGRTVTLHDNCYAKAAGNTYFEQARRLLGLCGVKVVEMRHNHMDALCCGFGRGAGWRKNSAIPFDIIGGTMKRIREAEETGVDTLVTYCAGCFWLLLAARELMESPIKIVHSVELVREAMGEEVNFPRQERTLDILAALTYQIMNGIGRKHFWVQDVRAEIDPVEWRSRPHYLLKAVRKGLDSPAIRDLYRAGFRRLARIMG
jgi:Fe-S oxidoreductase